MPTPSFKDVTVPADGQPITHAAGRLQVPDRPIIPFIEGDGTGPDIWRASVRVFDAAVQKAYGGRRKIAWMEVLAGEKAFKRTNNWLPDDTVARSEEHTSELQSRLHLVCRLLLEKKKKKTKQTYYSIRR